MFLHVYLLFDSYKKNFILFISGNSMDKKRKWHVIQDDWRCDKDEVVRTLKHHPVAASMDTPF